MRPHHGGSSRRFPRRSPSVPPSRQLFTTNSSRGERSPSWRSPFTRSPLASSARPRTDSKGIEYEVLDLSADENALEAVKSLGYLQAPVVIADEDHWSGFRPDKIEELAQRLA
jgi:glutaredoxin-like protein NrdH